MAMQGTKYSMSGSPLAAVAAIRNVKEKTMTNVFRQFLTSTYNVRALLEDEAMFLTDILVIFGSGEID